MVVHLPSLQDCWWLVWKPSQLVYVEEINKLCGVPFNICHLAFAWDLGDGTDNDRRE